ncbi:hypothetical protein ACIBG7_18590 [Nonomuraea sp. NPDC050328]|uniref:DUF7426 family protein n=1 Tax=Nonomuraea sp. NPDC050328 TaxID=3364361 RepID=UPI003797C486
MPKFPEMAASLGETLDLPVPLPNGRTKTYVIQPLDADTWARFASGMRALGEDDEPVDEEVIFRKALGDEIYDELAADGAAWVQIRRCGATAMQWHMHGEERALQVWEGGVPKRLSTSETDDQTETQEEGPSTPRRASGSGTTPNRRTQGSRGSSSSGGGRSSK